MNNKETVDKKIQKYQYKLKKSTDPEKNKIYSEKIDFYMKGYGNNISELILAPPDKLNNKNVKLYEDTGKIIAYGYGVMEKYKNLEPVLFERRQPWPSDIVIEIIYCGVCHSDWHYIVGEWLADYPLVPGHEICGKIIKLGSSVKNFKVGDNVLVGTYVNSCKKCDMCKAGKQQYCVNDVSWTYNSRDRMPNSLIPNGELTYGGYSNIITVNKNYVFKCPPNLPIETLGPLLCAGITTYSPLKEANIGPGKIVGIAGIGGLGHIAVKLARAMGAHVIAFTTSEWKVKDSKRLGANDSVLMSNTDKFRKYHGKLDLLIDTIPKIHDFNNYLKLINVSGTYCILGYFGDINLDTNILATPGRYIKSSITGGIPTTDDLLNFCMSNKIYPEVEIINLNNVNDTYQKIIDKKVKYRFVLDMKN